MGRAVFVSYSQPDRGPALGLVAHLEAHGIDCWVAPRDVEPGSDWAAQIIEAIAAARVMVLVFSASANASPQVRREVERAVHRRVAVLPFRVEDVLPSSSLEYFLSSQHWLDAFPPPLEPHYARLGAYLKSLLAAGAEPPAAPAAAGARGAVPSAAALKRVELELARYIGPVARHLVNRVAARTFGLETLIAQLGAEIESEADRRAFLGACRQALRERS
ncbi:MAG TPA: toll/interleukin-1 receptor domain-containing protein [Steroidobacteraceae bacterium]|nr:toll/interleukin-1 receptor domain-containing protein [Steroidobacteraceae bacterium]